MRTLSMMMTVLAIGVWGCGGGSASSSSSTTTASAHSGNTSNAQGGGSHEEIRTGFLHGCQEECSAGAETCAHYCGCMLDHMEQDGLEARVAQLNADPGAVTTDPFFQRAISTCQPDLITSSWVSGCASEDPSRQPLCTCVLGRLCAGRSESECALWVLQNPHYGEQPAEVTELQQAAQLCMGGQHP